MSAWSSALGLITKPPYWPDGMMLSAVSAKSSAYSSPARALGAAASAATATLAVTSAMRFFKWVPP